MSVAAASSSSTETTAVASVGSSALEFFGELAAMWSVFRRTLQSLVRGVRQPGAALRQMYEIGNRSLVFLCVVMGFIGMIFVYQTGLQTKRVIPDLSLLGATYLELLVRYLGPTISALMLTTRVGAGIAAEIGSMVVTEQVDALRMCAADPIDYLIKPRFIACLVMTTILVVMATAVAFVSGMLTGQVYFELSPRTFFDTSLIDAVDLGIGLTECLVYGATIPIVSGHCGLTAFGGSEGVGQSTTRAVVNTSLCIVIQSFVISGAGYVVFGI
jgi:phospholipid/cholesterol/gamma-HCH transport system permease protein